MQAILTYMTGEELLMLRILNGESVHDAVEAELDRRARLARTRRLSLGETRAARPRTTDAAPLPAAA